MQYATFGHDDIEGLLFSNVHWHEMKTVISVANKDYLFKW